MRILFDHQIFSAQSYGGISRYFYELASRISSIQNTRAEIFSPLYQNKYLESDVNDIVRGIHFRGSPFASRILGEVNNLISNIKMASCKNIDIFHETYYNFQTTKPSGSAFITTIHDMIPELFPDEFGIKSKISINKKRSIFESDHIICVSKSTKNDLINIYGVPESKVSVIYLGSSLSGIECTNLDHDGKPFLLYVGNRPGYKNFKSLIKSIASSNYIKNNYRLVCFGGGDITKREALEISESGFPITELVHLDGDDSKLAWLYRNASMLVLPSHYEGFGIPILEAMSLGCPIACSNAGSIPEVASDAAAYFDQTNIESISDCLESLLSSPSRMKELSVNGLERQKKFSWDKCAMETHKVYEAAK